MGSISKFVILSTCVALSFAQDYEYSINADKVSVRQGPNTPSKFQEQPAIQSQPSFQAGSSFPRAPPRQPAQFTRFQSIPQVRPQQSFAQEPQQFENEAPFAAPARIQSKPTQFRQGSASTYVPTQNGNSFRPASAQNSFRPAAAPVQNAQSFQPAPVQSEPSFAEEQGFAPAPVQPQPQQFQPEQTFQAQPEQDSFVQQPVRRPSKTRISSSIPLSSSSNSPKAQSAEDLAIIQEQNAGAKYAFSSNVDNGIQDNSLHREEVRDGLALRGMYSYSDGFYKRIVQYEADENGYRVVGESAEPIGNLEGPQLNLNGKAQVNTDIQGTGVDYSITADDVVDLRKLKNKQSNFRVVA